MKYLLADHVSLTEVDDEAVLLDLHSGAYFGLNHVGARFAIHLKAQKSVDFATADIIEHYQASAATVKHDIAILLEQLLERKLIIQG